ncbi:putative odorant receptor 85e [Amyelois transitella]|uniref:putative odorant receptor 85e n=1 Tax=Amyelois transitella TaxID=680683 RepID=UPI00067BB966|nr:putative odorant receptor 85e [Amyelois transitella]
MFFRKKPKQNTTINTEKITNYTHFLEIPLKIVGCWDWYPEPRSEYQIILNNVYICMVLFVLTNIPMTLFVNLYIEWAGMMDSLDELADCMPSLVSIAIVCYFVVNRKKMYDLIGFMNNNFEYYSANGLTNMTMLRCYKTAKNFAYFYTACTMFSVTLYVIPEIVNLWKKLPLQNRIYADVTRSPFLEFAFIRQCLGQAFIGLAMGQLGVFFASNAILLCGQLDLLCCSVRNARFSALLQGGTLHTAIAKSHADILDDELHHYIYNTAEMTPSENHYGRKMQSHFVDKMSNFDIYSNKYDKATVDALRDCARVCQIINVYKDKFEQFVSPLLALRVIQVTLYLCTLLYAATLQFDMVTVEYLAAVALDIFVYCYYGNQIILQADRVSTAAYQGMWHTMGVRPRRMLLNILLANRRQTIVRAGRFLPMDLHTFVVIIKTSFSYYTLLVNVNENHD